jgi:pseudaminic acid synthase
MPESIDVGGLRISNDGPPLVIAEMSGNHNHSLERALALVDQAASAGAHALKIQTYTADTMTIDLAEGDFLISDPTSLWCGRTLHDLYREAHTPWEWHQPIFARARERGVVPFSTPFDETAVDFLESLDAPLYKIASFELTDIPLISRVARTGKPALISTGMGTHDEIREAVDAFRANGNMQLVLLKCTSNYPAPFSSLNLATLPALAEDFDCLVGLSDHTLGSTAAIASTALGASVIEKHFTLSRDDGGVDSAFSAEPEELVDLVRSTRSAHEALGTVHFAPTSTEERSLQFRRSLYVVSDIRAGEAFTKSNVRSIRPGYGLKPRHLPEVIGRRATCDVKRGTALDWALVDDAE